MTHEKKRKMAEHPSKYSAADKALYRLSMLGGEVHELAEVMEAGLEKLQQRIKELEEGLKEQAELWELAEQDLNAASDIHRQVAFHVEHQPAEKARLLAEKEKG